ncbi:hypothetical protein HBI67_052590 [Parastagonospora nodorum]|nr:hypothetical protein HBI67_052590 [Parastagonospora nodorum]KAH6089621.1 hypothetical protein HBI66_027130 [Parastagonospora nodorum]
MSTKSADADSRENSPDHEASPGGRRTSKKRKVLSCYACRDRKMKCDRVYPVCGRCQKTGRSNQCTYDPRLLDDLIGKNGDQTGRQNPTAMHPQDATRHIALPSSSGSSLESMQLQARAQERRIEDLERQLAAAKRQENSNHSSRYSDFVPVELDQGKEALMFRGKGFKTQFHGSTSVMSTIAQFRELQAFTREALMLDNSIMRLTTDFKTFRDRRKMANKQNDARTLGIDQEIFAALPDRSIVDLQVALYFQTWENTYRVLHEPSFWKEYTTFWEQRAVGGSPNQPGFAAILLLMIASIKSLAPKDDLFEGDTTSDRLMASNIIDLCDAWIGRQPRKRLTLQFFQIRILSVLAKRVNCVKLKQDWVTSGDLVRLALAAGMHRDPSLVTAGKVPQFEREMKKRLWITIMELELQSSLESGLQSSLTALYWDSPAPANVPDDALTTEVQELPASRPLEYFTSASYLCVSAKSIPLRLHLMQLLNDPSARLQYSEVLQYDAQIHELLRSLPQWDIPSATIPMALLRLQLRQFVFILHQSFAKLASQNERYAYSFTACVESTSAIANTHNELVSQGILVLNNMRNDIIRTGLMLSRIVYFNCALHGPVKASRSAPALKTSYFADGQTHFADMPSGEHLAPDLEVSLAIVPQHSFLARTLCISAIDVLNLAGQTYERKVMRMGTGYMEYWLLTAAINMLPPSPSSSFSAQTISPTDDISARCRRTLDQFMTVALRMLELQKDPEARFASSLRTTLSSVSPSDVRTPKSGGASIAASNVGLVGSHASNNGQHLTVGGMELSDGNDSKGMDGTFDTLQDMQVDLSGWTFPDFWAFDLSGDF